ncbi:hypothetical protein, partial [Sphingobium quisquiliarum]|uniref:hypothetical protein n=1 Tax=Sphingobium quisquiliarum TaxID=538379 RepID=UPI00059E0DA2
MILRDEDKREPRSTGEAALMIEQALRDGDILYLADDEQQAEALAEAAAALAPAHPVIFIPSSDALPGDRA